MPLGGSCGTGRLRSCPNSTASSPTPNEMGKTTLFCPQAVLIQKKWNAVEDSILVMETLVLQFTGRTYSNSENNNWFWIHCMDATLTYLFVL
ncbi:unnamed protein product [Linum tenue]|uniref:Uncharacterized protein n=1 Tax=Linum tenue TaxID=586396 RepID=A0AAV0QX17_9ROSI|nr:unnamed protein product [Linum tenue]